MLPRLTLFVVLSLGLVACGSDPDGDPLLVFAAASLADALTEAGAAWEAEHPGEPVDFSFAGSNDLARQIAAGAPAGLFVAADRERLERAAAGGRLDLGRAVALLGNELVVVVPAAGLTGEAVPEVRSARDLLAFERLGLADPEAVPAGVYARRWLESAGVWEELAPRVVPALDVRANLAAVASGSVPAGIVYATDAAGASEAGGVAGRVRVVLRVEAPVVYWAATVSDGGRSEGHALRFLDYLAHPEAGAIFRRHGFRHLPTGGGRGAPGD